MLQDSCVLLPHQHEGIQFILNRERFYKGGILADDMGMGKTLQMIAACGDDAKSNQLGDILPTLIVCPRTLTIHWQREILRHTTLKADQIIIFQGIKRLEWKFIPNQVMFVITNYATLYADLRDPKAQTISRLYLLRDTSWHRVVLDEAHAIRNPDSGTFHAVCKLRCEYRWALTGTPFHNSESDIASICAFLRLAPFDNPEWWRTATQPQLAHFHTQYVLRRNSDILKLPDFRVVDVEVPLSPEEQDVMNHEIDDCDTRWSDNLNSEEKNDYLTAFLRLRQCCNDRRLAIPADDCIDCNEHQPERTEALHCRRHIRCHHCAERRESDHCDICEGGRGFKASSRTEYLMRTVQQIRTEDPSAAMVVFSQWSAYLTLLEIELKRLAIPYLRLDGAVARIEEQEKIMDQFQLGTGTVLLCTFAFGVGHNFSRANHVFLMDLWFNPQIAKQAAKRTHRIGQSRPVTVYRLRSDAQVDEYVHNVQQRKHEASDHYMFDTQDHSSQSFKALPSVQKIWTQLIESRHREKRKLEEEDPTPAAKRSRQTTFT